MNMRKIGAIIVLLIVTMVSLQAKEPVFKTKKIRHLVLLKFKKGTTPEQIARIDTLVWNLEKEIKVVHHLEWGKSLEMSNETEEYDYCLSIIFRSKTDMTLYDQHPAHQRLKAAIIPIASKIIRFNYMIE